VSTTAAQDVVAVFNSDLVQVFTQARAIKANVDRSSKAMEHPLETGATITDHRIILPVSIDLSLLLVSEDYQAVYQQVRDLFKAGALLTVQTRADSFPSMLIEKMPHDESPDMYDGIALALTLKQAQFVQPQFSTYKVAAAKDSNTVPRGQQEGTESTRRSSILSGVF
jgi:hypothetical protein